MENMIYVKNKDYNSVEIGDELAFLNEETGKYHVINEIGASIWQLLDTVDQPKQIVDKLMEEYDIEKEQCLKEVVEFLDGLLDAKLVSRGSS